MRYRRPTKTEVLLLSDFEPNTIYHKPFIVSKTFNKYRFMDIDNEASFDWIL